LWAVEYRNTSILEALSVIPLDPLGAPIILIQKTLPSQSTERIGILELDDMKGMGKGVRRTSSSSSSSSSRGGGGGSHSRPCHVGLLLTCLTLGHSWKSE